jgi:hypothetical protein
LAEYRDVTTKAGEGARGPSERVLFRRGLRFIQDQACDEILFRGGVLDIVSHRLSVFADVDPRLRGETSSSISIPACAGTRTDGSRLTST